MAEDYYKHEGTGPVPAGPNEVEEARKRHHLATADPEPERGDGTLTGPAHEEKYGLDRAEHSAELWRAAGVHPTENRALLETADASEASEKAVAPRVKK